MKYTDIIFFHNGSIGDFLMTIFLMENIHLNDKSARLHIAVPRNVQLCREIAVSYPYIHILPVNSQNLGVFKLLPFIFRRTCCITPPTPGVLPLATKTAARVVALHPKSTLLGFRDKSKIGSFLYTKILPFDVSKLYFETMLQIVHEIRCETKRKAPTFQYESAPNALHAYGLQEEEYIVLHPFGSSEGRSILEDDLSQLVEKIAGLFPGKKIVISGSEADAKKIPENAKQYIVDVCGKTTIRELATIIDSAAFFVGVDTGITHLASVLYKKSIVIAHLGSTSYWLPYYNENAIILYHVKKCPHDIYQGREHLLSCCKNGFRCMDEVPFSVIEDALKEEAGMYKDNA